MTDTESLAMLKSCYVDNQLKKQEQISFLNNLFHGQFAVVFFSFFSVDISVMSTTALLCLPSLSTLPFTFSDSFLFCSAFFLSASFVSLFLNCFPPSLTDFSLWQLGLEPKPAEVNPLPSKSLGSRLYSHLLPCFFYKLLSHAAFSVVFPY